MDAVDSREHRIEELEHEAEECIAVISMRRIRLRAIETELRLLRAGRPTAGTTMTDTIVSVLVEAGSPVRVRDLVRRLAELGFATRSKNVSALLSDLGKRGRVVSAGHGLWAVARPPADRSPN